MTLELSLRINVTGNAAMTNTFEPDSCRCIAGAPARLLPAGHCEEAADACPA